MLAADGVTVRTASLYGNPWTFTGRRLDSETGLMYYRARYYSVELGRFIGRDPIGYKGSKWNLYEYVKGRSTKYLDPFGLEDDLGTGAAESSFVYAIANWPTPTDNPLKGSPKNEYGVDPASLWKGWSSIDWGWGQSFRVSISKPLAAYQGHNAGLVLRFEGLETCKCSETEWYQAKRRTADDGKGISGAGDGPRGWGSDNEERFDTRRYASGRLFLDTPGTRQNLTLITGLCCTKGQLAGTWLFFMTWNYTKTDPNPHINNKSTYSGSRLPMPDGFKEGMENPKDTPAPPCPLY